MNQGIGRVAIFFMLLTGVTAGACSHQPVQELYHEPASGNDEWQTASPADVGVDPAQIDDVLETIRSEQYAHLQSLLLVKDGKLILEEYLHGYGPRRPHYVASVTKSVTSILIGIAIDQGIITGSDQPVAELLPAYADLFEADPEKSQLKLWHLLTMSSGLEWDEETYPYSDPRNDCRRLDQTNDGPRLALERPIVSEPGTHFQYSCANTMLLSAIIESTSGMRADRFAERYLFHPLGITDYQWELYGDGLAATDGGLHIRPRDMAKIGQLMLNGGQWQGRQIVSAAWVLESTKARLSTGPLAEYGYQWWWMKTPVSLESVETYFAAGYGGQQIIVAPSLDLVITITSDLDNHDENSGQNHVLLTERILPAMMPLVLSKGVLFIWYGSIGLSMAIILLDRRQARNPMVLSGPVWALIGVVFGPIGLAGYLFARRLPGASLSLLHRTLAESLFSVTGNVIGLLAVIVIQVLYFPDDSAVLQAIVAAFVVGWLFFRMPKYAREQGQSYLSSLPRTVLVELISTLLALVGMFPVIILLTLRWFAFGMNPASPLFWIMLSWAAVVGASIVLPLNIFLARRESVHLFSHQVA